MKNKDFERALDLFKLTLKSPHNRGASGVAEGMLALATEDNVTAASLEVVSALAAGARVWMTSDLHFHHTNIISYCDRPFGNVNTMNAELRKVLEKVGSDDLVVFVGDMVMGSLESSIPELQGLPGKKILVVGNHDFMNSGKPRYPHFREGDGSPVFERIVPFLFWTDFYQPRPVMVTHYPLSVPEGYSFGQVRNYHGHLHDTLLTSNERVKFINVGWDVNHGLNCL